MNPKRCFNQCLQLKHSSCTDKPDSNPSAKAKQASNAHEGLSQSKNQVIKFKASDSGKPLVLMNPELLDPN